MENAVKRFNWLELNGFLSAKLCQLKKTSRKIPRVVLNPPWKKNSSAKVRSCSSYVIFLPKVLSGGIWWKIDINLPPTTTIPVTDIVLKLFSSREWISATWTWKSGRQEEKNCKTNFSQSYARTHLFILKSILRLFLCPFFIRVWN